jgi:hypothetical protein
MGLSPFNFLILTYWGLQTSGLTSRGVLFPEGNAGFTQRRCPMATTSHISIYGDCGIIATLVLE